MNRPFEPEPGGRVHVLAPAGLTTGGPEALHQLAGGLAAAGHEAVMVYLAGLSAYGKVERAVRDEAAPERYRAYGTRAASAIRDDPGDVIVVPEVWSRLVYSFRRARRVIWWLSVDNNVVAPLGQYFSGRLDPLVGHLYQSAYARSYLASNGVGDACELRDYLSHQFLQAPRPMPDGRADRVLFNPRKGLKTTRAIIERARARSMRLEFAPIHGMSAEQVVGLMRSSKAYIDFGAHPGMDRMPREAAMCGLAVLTGSNGAAGWQEDTPLPAGARFGDWQIDAVLDRLGEIMSRFADAQEAYAPYRAFIEAQPGQFQRDSAAAFGLPGRAVA